jgi:hypothetical protein
MTQEEATAIAKSIVVVLCGDRWTNPPVRMTDEYPLTESGWISLAGRPVREIHSVTVNGEAVAVTIADVRNRFLLRLPTSVRRLICNPDTAVEVDYTYGVLNLPVVLQRAIDEMAAQILLAENNDAECKIPERVTNIQRQGVSWTLLDPQDFLEKGRTGIYEVDLAIQTLNPARAHRRARIFSPSFGAPAIRRRSL